MKLKLISAATVAACLAHQSNAINTQSHKQQALRGEHEWGKVGEFVNSVTTTVSNWWNGLPNELNVKVWNAAQGDLHQYPWPEQQLPEVMAKENVGISISEVGQGAWQQPGASCLPFMTPAF